MRPTVACLSFLTLLAAGVLVAQSQQSFERIEPPGLHNTFRVAENIFSGSQPEGDVAFATLARLGVRTIVSVDGSVPDVVSVKQHGLRYIHLPFGYDGVPKNRIAELTKVAAEARDPIYVHCHHGLHRGPAAVAVMCEAAAGWTPAQAKTWLREAGTAADYPGLYRAAQEFRMPTAAELAAVKRLPEVTKPSTLVEAMVTIDEHFSRLKQAQKSGWQTPPGQADITPAHEATILWEQFRELERSAEARKRPEEYRAKLMETARVTHELRETLKAGTNNTVADAALQQVSQSCSACHLKYRNQ